MLWNVFDESHEFLNIIFNVVFFIWQKYMKHQPNFNSNSCWKLIFNIRIYSILPEKYICSQHWFCPLIYIYLFIVASILVKLESRENNERGLLRNFSCKVQTLVWKLLINLWPLLSARYWKCFLNKLLFSMRFVIKLKSAL